MKLNEGDVIQAVIDCGTARHKVSRGDIFVIKFEYWNDFLLIGDNIAFCLPIVYVERDFVKLEEETIDWRNNMKFKEGTVVEDKIVGNFMIVIVDELAGCENKCRCRYYNHITGRYECDDFNNFELKESKGYRGG